MSKKVVVACAVLGLLIWVAISVEAGEKIRVAFSPQTDTAHIRLATRLIQGVEVEVVPIKTFVEAQIALQTGDIQFGTLGVNSIATLADAGVKTVKVVAGYVTGTHVLSVRKGVQLKTWKDLEGKTVGSITGSMAHFRLLMSLKHHGVDLNKVKIVHYAPGPPILAAMKEGSVDAVMVWDPMAAQIKLAGTGDYSGLDVTDNPAGPATGVIGVNADFERKHPEIVQKFVDALIEATKRLKANREEWIRLAIEATGASREVIEESFKHMDLNYLIFYDKAAGLTRAAKPLGMTKTDVSGAEDTIIEWKYLEKATGKSRKDLRG